MLKDLVSYYGNNDKAILEAIRSHHRETFGTLDDFKLTIINSSGEVLLDKYEPLPGSSTTSVILRKFAIVNSHAVNITIQVW